MARNARSLLMVVSGGMYFVTAFAFPSYTHFEITSELATIQLPAHAVSTITIIYRDHVMIRTDDTLTITTDTCTVIVNTGKKNKQSGIVQAECHGNVCVKHKALRITAQQAAFNPEKQVVDFDGDVIFVRRNQNEDITMRAPHASLDLATSQVNLVAKKTLPVITTVRRHCQQQPH